NQREGPNSYWLDPISIKGVKRRQERGVVGSGDRNKRLVKAVVCTPEERLSQPINK
ncbi:unnamed protein product, partial [Ilex paraguariensis]